MKAHLYLFSTQTTDSCALAARCLRDYAEQYQIFLSDLTLLRTPQGKPYLEGDRLFLSISHTEQLWGCVVAPCPVGLDLQAPRPVAWESIARRFFTSEEQCFLQDHPDQFFALWTAKEAFAKLDGRGLGMGLSTFSTAGSAGFHSNIQGCPVLHFLLPGEVSGCIVSQDSLELYIEPIKNRL